MSRELIDLERHNEAIIKAHGWSKDTADFHSCENMIMKEEMSMVIATSISPSS